MAEGAELEYHKVQTEDGYILTLFRVSRAANPKISKVPETEEKNEITSNEIESSKPPVLLVHGVLASGTMWLLDQPNKTLPHKLVNAGYDVWIANLRGAPNSRKHITLKTKSKKFWDFGWHEMSYYDLPAMIDYMLDTTGKKSIFYVGHSMGCSVFMGLMSTKPEYSSKISTMVALAPAVLAKNFRNKPLRNVVAPISATMGKVKIFRRGEMFPKPANKMMKSFCLPSGRFSNYLGKKVGRMFGAMSKHQVEKDRMPSVMNNFPASTSAKTICHGMQCLFTNQFKYFDYGRSGNIKKYGQPTPPFYDLSRCKVPVATFYSEYDEMCTSLDVTHLTTKLPNCIGNYGICSPEFAHGDFMIGKDANKLCYETVLKIFEDCLNTGENKCSEKIIGKETLLSSL